MRYWGASTDIKRRSTLSEKAGVGGLKCEKIYTRVNTRKFEHPRCEEASEVIASVSNVDLANREFLYREWIRDFLIVPNKNKCTYRGISNEKLK